MNTYDKNLDLKVIEGKIGYIFKDKNILQEAFTHRSYLNENKHISQKHNERLEFLGDAILGLLIVEHLYKKFPSKSEGELSNLLSKIVDSTSCTEYIKKINVENNLLLGKGEKFSKGKGKKSILADLFEAIIGAIYLDGGLNAAKDYLFKNFNDEIDFKINSPEKNWKAILQDYTQKELHTPPKYIIHNEEGPEHQKTFTVDVLIKDEICGTGSGFSKKEAQQSAAKDATNKLNILKS